ncbi:MAG TPA: hypothetical protein VLE23_20690, partial [Geminicoccaceae bacterium]|nr:hypothetical protein [Geminicoccaceae bacterium]
MIEPCHQAEAAAATALPAELPQWDLGDLYESPTAPDVTSDLRDALAAAAALAAEYKGKLAALDGAALAEVIARFERIEEQLGRVNSYA